MFTHITNTFLGGRGHLPRRVRPASRPADRPVRLVSNCDEGVTDNDGLNITTREVPDVIDEAKLKDAPESVYDYLSVLTGFITSALSSLLSLSHTMVLFPIELNLIQILGSLLETAFTFVFKYSQA